MPKFINRERELASLGDWWSVRAGALALVWGRRRVGKTALLTEFARDRRSVFHTASGRPREDELRLLSLAARDVVGTGIRDLSERPFRDWSDAFETLAGAADTEPLLVVLDEFPELVRTSPELESTLRAVWDRVRARTKLRVFLSGLP